MIKCTISSFECKSYNVCSRRISVCFKNSLFPQRGPRLPVAILLDTTCHTHVHAVFICGPDHPQWPPVIRAPSAGAVLGGGVQLRQTHVPSGCPALLFTALGAKHIPTTD